MKNKLEIFIMLYNNIISKAWAEGIISDEEKDKIIEDNNKLII